MFSVSKKPTISEIHQLYREEKAKPSQITTFFLNRSHELDKDLNAFYTYTKDIAETRAAELDKMLLNATVDELIKEMPLFGIPCSVKANILVEGVETHAGSKALKDYIAPYSSTVYNKIFDAGALLIGMNNMDEFASGASGETNAYGVTKNPYGHDRVPGGSSSGPIAAVSSGQVVFSLGSDTGGSIRQPAAFCNVVGLKPTYGLVSRWGVIAMASSLDQVGGITHSVQDNIIINTIISGEDENDQSTINSEETKVQLESITEGLRKKRQATSINQTPKPYIIGIPKEFYIDGINPQIREALEDMKNKLSKLGHHFKEVSIPMIKHAISVYYVTMPVELSANLERYDGIRYAAQEEYEYTFTDHRKKYFGDEIHRRIMIGTYASSAGYLDAYYNQAQKIKEIAVREFEEVFEEVDLLFAPTTPEFPFKIGQKSDDPWQMYLSDVFTCGLNPTRLPAINVPLGLFDVDGEKLPTGCQIIGPELHEDDIYRVAREVEILAMQ